VPPIVQISASPTDEKMLRLAVLFLVLGLIAGLLGFTGIAGASFAIAKLLFGIFLLIFLVLLVLGLGVFRGVSRG
jgi:uncharacterized membrane protein YtjA (UPF0391 family)